MKRFVLLLAAVVALALSMPAQDAAKASSTKKSSAKTTASSDKTAGAKSSQLTGCLATASGGSGFTLTNGRYTSGVAVSAGSGVDLAPHAGHKVQLMGTWDKGSDPKTKSFTATGVKHISEQCTAAGKAGAGAGKKGKKAADASAAPKS